MVDMVIQDKHCVAQLDSGPVEKLLSEDRLETTRYLRAFLENQSSFEKGVCHRQCDFCRTFKNKTDQRPSQVGYNKTTTKNNQINKYSQIKKTKYSLDLEVPQYVSPNILHQTWSLPHWL